MVAADLTRKEDRDRGIIEVPITGMKEPLRLLRVVAIYGPNASGKSTVLTAANALGWFIVHSSPQARPDENIRAYEPFLLDDLCRNAPITLGCDVAFESSILRYEIQFNRNAIILESLSRLEEGTETKLIDRQQKGKILGSLIEKSDANKLYVKKMQPNVSVLSKFTHNTVPMKEKIRRSLIIWPFVIVYYAPITRLRRLIQVFVSIRMANASPTTKIIASGSCSTLLNLPTWGFEMFKRSEKAWNSRNI